MSETPIPEAAAPEATPTAQKFEEVFLETQILRGTTTIDKLQLRKPKAGELRGLQLDSLMSGDVNSVMALLPRIATPLITSADVEAMDMADLAACGGAIKGFFMSKAEQQLLARFMGIAEAEESTG